MAPLTDTDVVIVEAVRSPLGKRNGGLSTMHPVDLLGAVQVAALERSGMDPAAIGQVVGGCVGQVGPQTFNIARTAWLSAGLPLEVAATTVDAQCGSSQQATNLAVALVKGGVVDSALSCGIEMMSKIPLGAAVIKELDRPLSKSYFARYEATSQFEGAERIADKWGITRKDCDAFGKQSQDRAAQAWAEDRFGTQIVPIGDGASAVLMMERTKAEALGLRPIATIVETCLVGCDPVLMLEGPIPATRKLLDDNGLTIDDIDIVEINEAFASVVL